VALVDDAGNTWEPRRRKPLALLAYLVLEERRWPIRRDLLAALLWPEASEERARRSLAQAMLVLRRELGEDVLPRNEREIRLCAPVSTDLDLLAELPHGDLSEPLGGLDHVAGAEYAHWVDAARLRLRDAARGILSRQLEQARRDGDARRVHERAVQLYEIDPLSELAIQALCEQAVVDGDVPGAVKRLRAHMARFESETGIAVSAGLRRLQQMIEEGHIATRRVDATAPRASRHQRPEAFIGRQVELSRLEHQWEAVQQGGRKTCLVAGPAGIGKSSLLVRFSTSVAVRAAVVLEVACQEIGSNIPFAAVSDLLGALARYPAVTRTEERWLSEACRVAPGLKARFNGIPDPPPVPPDAVRVRTAQALIRIIEAVAEDGPVLLVLDDLAYLDPASRDILHLLLHRLERARLLFVSAARTTGELASAWQDPEARVGIAWDETVSLPPLAEAESRQMITALCGGEAPGEAETRALIDLADGTPYLIEMLASEWRRHPEGSLVDGYVRGDDAATQWRPNQMMHRVFERQHRGLSADADHLLSLLAVAGRKLSAGEMGRLLGIASGASDAAALELLDRGVVRIEDGALSFKNQLHRRYAYATTGEDHRRFLHGQVASELERSGKSEFRDMLEAAHHYRRGGRPQVAVDTLVVGVEFALSKGAPKEAARAIERTTDPSEPYRRGELRVLLAESMLAQGRHLEADSLVGNLDLTTLQVQCRARAILVRSEAQQRGQLVPHQILADMTREALTLAQETEDNSLVLRALQLTAEVAHDAADAETIAKVQELARIIADSATHDAVLPTASVTIGFCLMVQGQHEQAVHHFTVGTDGLRTDGRETELRRALNGLGICLTNTGETRRAVDCFEDSRRLAENAGDTFAQGIVWDNLAVIYEDAGLFQDAAEARRLAYRLSEASPTDKRRAEILINAASLATTLGNFDEAKYYLDLADEMTGRLGIPGLVITGLLARADVCIAQSDHNAAWSWTEQALAIADGQATNWRPIGDFERVRLHFVLATQGYDAYRLALREERGLGLSFRLAQRLELKAFQEWVEQHHSAREFKPSAIRQLAENEFFGAILRLAVLGICPVGIVPSDAGLANVQRVIAVFPDRLQLPLPARVDVPLGCA